MPTPDQMISSEFVGRADIGQALPDLAILGEAEAPAPRFVRKGDSVSLVAKLGRSQDGTFLWVVTAGGDAATILSPFGDTVTLDGLTASAELDDVVVRCSFVPSATGEEFVGPPEPESDDAESAGLSAEIKVTVYELTITPATSEGFVGQRVLATAKLVPPALEEGGTYSWDAGAGTVHLQKCLEANQFITCSHFANPNKDEPKIGTIPKGSFLPYEGTDPLPNDPKEFLAVPWNGNEGFTERENVERVDNPLEASRRVRISAASAGTVNLTCSFTSGAEGAEAILAAPVSFTFSPPQLLLRTDTGNPLPAQIGAGSLLVLQARMHPPEVDENLLGQRSFAWSVSDADQLELVTGLQVRHLEDHKWFFVNPTGNAKAGPDLPKGSNVAWADETGPQQRLHVFYDGREGYLNDNDTTLVEGTLDKLAVVRGQDDPGATLVEVTYTVGEETYTATATISVVGVEITRPDDTPALGHVLVGEEVEFKLKRTPPGGAGTFSWAVTSDAVEIVGSKTNQTVILRGTQPSPDVETKTTLRCAWSPGANTPALAATHELLVSEVVFSPPAPSFLAVGETLLVEVVTRPGTVPGLFTWSPEQGGALVAWTPGERGILTVGAGDSESLPNEVVLCCQFARTETTHVVPKTFRLTVVALRLVEINNGTAGPPPLLLKPGQPVTLEPEADDGQGEYTWQLTGGQPAGGELAFLNGTSTASGPQVTLQGAAKSGTEADATIRCQLEREGQTTAVELQVTVGTLEILSWSEAEFGGALQPLLSIPYGSPLEIVVRASNDAIVGTCSWSENPASLSFQNLPGAVHRAQVTASSLFQGTIKCVLTSSSNRRYEVTRETKVTFEDLNDRVVEVANAYTQQGGRPVGEGLALGDYKLPGGGTGVPEDIFYPPGTLFLEQPPGRTTYCSGFTFAVMWFVAREAGLIADDTFNNSQKWAFQQTWFGAGTTEDKEYQSVKAMEDVDIGKRIDDPNDAKPGDFLQYLRADEGYDGHSCIFMGWVMDGADKIGVQIRGSNSKPSPGGIGSKPVYFNGLGPGGSGKIRFPTRFYVGRLKK